MWIINVCLYETNELCCFKSYDLIHGRHCVWSSRLIQIEGYDTQPPSLSPISIIFLCFPLTHIQVNNFDSTIDFRCKYLRCSFCALKRIPVCCNKMRLIKHHTETDNNKNNTNTKTSNHTVLTRVSRLASNLCIWCNLLSYEFERVCRCCHK